MKTANERLVEARSLAGYDSAVDAARAMNIRESGYVHHENGTRGLSRASERYARFFRVSLDWLLTGKGEMRPKKQFPSIKLMGHVGAGPTAHRLDDLAQTEVIDTIDLPSTTDTFALQVIGDSGEPRYKSGDYLLVDKRVYLPGEMNKRYCVIDLADGRRVVKMLQIKSGVAWLYSQNNTVEPEIAPKIMGCYHIVGVLLAD